MPRTAVQILFLATSKIVEDHNARNTLLDKRVEREEYTRNRELPVTRIFMG